MKKTTLVIGASLKSERYSNKVIHKLSEKKIEVYAVGLRKGSVSDVIIHTEKVSFKDIDTVTMYINPTLQKEFYNYIIDLKPRRVIFNPGTENTSFINLLQENNIQSEVACTLVLLATNQY